MRRHPPPLRFLTAVLGVWICARALVLGPDWWVERSAAAPVAAKPPPIREALAAPQPMASAGAGERGPMPQVALLGRAERSAKPRPLRLRSLPGAASAPPPIAPRAPPFPRLEVAQGVSFPLPRQRAALRERVSGRLSGSAWLLLRGEPTAALAPGGTLGGSQGGVRLRYRLNGDPARPISLSARLYSPAASRRGAEAALGIDWRPLAHLPVHLLAERRQALGDDGRTAFVVAVHGGVSEHPIARGFRLDAYGQLGAVGARSPDLFADGGARVTLPVRGIRLGAGIWGGAQPGAARLDAGPHASIRLPLAGEQVHLGAEWRLRVAGDAAPGSGPVITLGTDF
jgi:hypothetical protein